jgi:hypothetical protein
MKSTSPLIAGFCRAVHPDFQPTFDTSQQLSRMRPNFQAIAEKYNVHTRTIRRWHAAGVDVQDFRAVAKHLAEQRRPSIHAIRASLSLLNSNP